MNTWRIPGRGYEAAVRVARDLGQLMFFTPSPKYPAGFLKAAPLKQTPKEQESTARATDRIEISPEAKMLQSNNVSGKDLEQIKERINTNFYHSDEVLAKVAQAIIKDMDNK